MTSHYDGNCPLCDAQATYKKPLHCHGELKTFLCTDKCQLFCITTAAEGVLKNSNLAEVMKEEYSRKASKLVEEKILYIYVPERELKIPIDTEERSTKDFSY